DLGAELGHHVSVDLHGSVPNELLAGAPRSEPGAREDDLQPQLRHSPSPPSPAPPSAAAAADGSSASTSPGCVVGTSVTNSSSSLSVGSSERSLSPNAVRNVFVVPYTNGRPTTFLRPAILTRP